MSAPATNPDIMAVVDIMKRVDERTRIKILAVAEDFSRTYDEAVAIAADIANSRRKAPVLRLASGGQAVGGKCEGQS